ncbi:MAG: aminoacyl--tRNA ligase-related protein [bacterium]
MKQSKLFTKTTKQAPKDEKSINAKLLIRGGFIHKVMAGVYDYLPLGLRVHNKIKNIIREEMNNINGQEIFMTVLQSKTLWQETDRWDNGIGKEVMYKCKDESGKEIGLGPTHEESITEIIRQFVRSYEDLPLAIYQIQTKFRKELRSKSGLLRGREFSMKDLYSFHQSKEDFKKYYEVAKEAYTKIFKRCGLETIITEASGGDFTKEYTHEFQVLSSDGEDEIIYCPNSDFSQNKEIVKVKAGDKCPKCDGILKQGNSIEVGNIFPLGIKYSQAMNANFVDKAGKSNPIIMGCYGIGLSRTMGAIVEIYNDDKGIIWPESIAPYQVHLLCLNKDEKVKKTADEIYSKMDNDKIEVLYDDRDDKSAGEKFADADLIGIPNRLVVSEKTLIEDSVELKKRNSEETELIKRDNIASIVNSRDF